MKKLLAAMITGSAFVATAASAADWTLLAGAESGYKAEPTASVLFGRMSPGRSGMKDGNITGLELSLNCPLLQPPTNRIRQQVSYTQYDESGTKIKNLEINPHYVVEVNPGLELGGGPGLAYITTSGTANNPNFWGVNLGLSAHYRGWGPVFVGAEYRYQFTNKKDFGGVNDNLNNGRFDVKVGYDF